MVGGEDGCRDFSGSEKMPKIGAGVAPANGAGTCRIYRTLVLRVPGILDKHAAFAGVKTRVTRRAGRQHTVHHVDAERDIIRNLLGAPDTHQITRAVAR